MSGARAPRASVVVCLALVLLLAGGYAAVMWQVSPPVARDLGGSYPYVVWRVSRGEVLYREVQGTQMPLAFLAGALVYRLWSQPAAILAFCLGCHVATVLGVWLAARACRFSLLSSVGACVLYLLLPMGFVFDARFEPGLVLVPGGLLCVLFLCRPSPRRAVAAGLTAALCILAKLIFPPLLGALALYLALTRRAVLAPFVGAAAGLFTLAVGAGWLVAGPAFLRGAFLAQVGTPLSWGGLLMALRYLWSVEGLTMVGAVLGAVLAWRDAAPRRLLAFYLLGGLAPLLATLKEGSLAPEVLMGEPAVALCAALAAEHAVGWWRRRRPEVGTPAPLAARALAVGIVATLVVGQALEARDDLLAVRAAGPSAEVTCELAALRRYAGGGAPVIVPANSAFLAQRRLVDNLDDYFALYHRDLAGEPAARAESDRLAGLIRRRAVPLVMILYFLPMPRQVERALARAYVRVMLGCPDTRLLVPARRASRRVLLTGRAGIINGGRRGRGGPAAPDQGARRRRGEASGSGDDGTAAVHQIHLL